MINSELVYLSDAPSFYEEFLRADILYKCEYSLGDVTKDGVIDNKDTEFIQRYLLKLEKLSKKDEVLADVNLDGHIDMSDVVKLIIDYKIK